MSSFSAKFAGIAGDPPFPWQSALYERLIAGELPRALDLPTGLGKTSVMAIWLLARAVGAAVPRRLVYVVDRRAVVDQATTVAEKLREYLKADEELRAALGLEGSELPISTLRGQHLDNREWLDDPSRPAIVVGTVDMVGSRLLFEGYGVSRKMRPYHAGFLGVDTLLVLDEAHLVPPFERMVEAVAQGRTKGLGPIADVAALVPELRLLSLSATGRLTDDSFTLTAADRDHEVVQARIGAKKIIQVRPAVDATVLAERLADEAFKLSAGSATPRRILVFCDTRTDALKTAEALRKRGGKAGVVTELFVGGRRAFERTQLAGWLKDHGFLAGGARPATTAFLIATSAGEVGVDLDADAAVMDVVAWERMVQRLGRVNRRGVDASDSTRRVSAPVVLVPVAGDERAPDQRKATLAALEHLPPLDSGVDGSPAAVGKLRQRARTEPDLDRLLTTATSPAALHPPLERALVDAWAMTSLDAHTGRPEVAPWLRGWVEEDQPQVTLCFRDHLPLDGAGKPLDRKALEAFMDVAGPHAAEELEAEVSRVLDWLTERAELDAESRKDDRRAAYAPVALAFDRDGAPRVVSLALLQDKRERDRLARSLADARLMVDARLGGLERGLLDAKARLPDADDISLDLTQREDIDNAVPFQVRRVEKLVDEPAQGLRLDKAFIVERNAEDQPTAWLVVERRGGEPISEAGRSIARRAQGLAEHQAWVEDEARRIATKLGLDGELTRALCIAARLHDEGKKADRWQRAFHVPPERRPLAKSTRAPNVRALANYRHELGSLQWVETDAEFAGLSDDLRDLVLHLVAAHHGRARPLLTTEGADEPPAKLRQRAQEIALRFDRLSRRYGPWGLAWLESLLRAADVKASRKNDEVARG